MGSRRNSGPPLGLVSGAAAAPAGSPLGPESPAGLVFLRFSWAGWVRAEVPAGGLWGGQARLHTGRRPGPRPMGPFLPSSSPQESFHLFLGRQSEPDVSPNRGRPAARPAHSAPRSRPGPLELPGPCGAQSHTQVGPWGTQAQGLHAQGLPPAVPAPSPVSPSWAW